MSDPSTPAKETGEKLDPGNDNAEARTVIEPEIGGRHGPDPTRFGDWEKDGRCIDF